jgi:hypothetical protein
MADPDERCCNGPANWSRVTKLRHRLWAEETFVDSEHRLNTAAKRRRDTLGDSAGTPLFIETCRAAAIGSLHRCLATPLDWTRLIHRFLS